MISEMLLSRCLFSAFICQPRLKAKRQQHTRLSVSLSLSLSLSLSSVVPTVSAYLRVCAFAAAAKAARDRYLKEEVKVQIKPQTAEE
jgi:hypothetical protein